MNAANFLNGLFHLSMLDGVIALIAAFNGVLGAKKGIINSMFFSIKFLADIIASYIVYKVFVNFIPKSGSIYSFILKLSELIQKNMNLKMDITNIVIFILCFIITSVVISLLFLFIKKSDQLDVLTTADRFFGFIYGVVKTIIVLMFICYFIDKISDKFLKYNLKETLSKSYFIGKAYAYNIFLNVFSR